MVRIVVDVDVIISNPRIETISDVAAMRSRKRDLSEPCYTRSRGSDPRLRP